MDEEKFETLQTDITSYLKGRELFVRDCIAGADPEHCVSIRIITETAWHNLFAKHLFISHQGDSEVATTEPAFTVIHAPSFRATPAHHGTNSETVIAVNFKKGLILIGGTHYAGEIKKSIFTVMNYLLPLNNVLSMHCSSNLGVAGDTALFFGLSGTGKTTLSSDVERRLIGDDEHGWSGRGIFNIEGGCYAKLIRLSKIAEPQIYATTTKFGTVIENVPIDQRTRLLNLDDDSLTENTRAAYPLSFIDGCLSSGQAGHPRNIFMLTADAFGVFPPVSRLTPHAAMYHFLSGYTAKVAGTEQGVTEPVTTFSTCFGEPFMVWDPSVYAKLLGERVAKYDVRVWLINTGWSGGPYGTGQRISITYTRAMVRAVLSGALDQVGYRIDPVFGVAVPTTCPEVPIDVLMPRSTWSSQLDYDIQAKTLAGMFKENFKKFESSTEKAVVEAGPHG
jgi:phosphoenolpyruvate carboxykinase (ATP)